MEFRDYSHVKLHDIPPEIHSLGSCHVNDRSRQFLELLGRDWANHVCFWFKDENLRMAIALFVHSSKRREVLSHFPLLELMTTIPRQLEVKIYKLFQRKLMSDSVTYSELRHVIASYHPGPNECFLPLPTEDLTSISDDFTIGWSR
jgi:hypothetical protein